MTTLRGGGMLKEIRIQADGRIVDADREIHTTRVAGNDGPDRVQWRLVPGATGSFTVRFDSSPFQFGPESINVPPGGPRTVTESPRTYKYKVYRNNAAGNPVEPPTDDPDVIIDS
jgi:hypothetical protein